MGYEGVNDGKGCLLVFVRLSCSRSENVPVESVTVRCIEVDVAIVGVGRGGQGVSVLWGWDGGRGYKRWVCEVKNEVVVAS